MGAKNWQPEDVAPAPLICRNCRSDVRDAIAELLNEGIMKEDGVRIYYKCPSCGAQRYASRTAGAPE